MRTRNIITRVFIDAIINNLSRPKCRRNKLYQISMSLKKESTKEVRLITIFTVQAIWNYILCGSQIVIAVVERFCCIIIFMLSCSINIIGFWYNWPSYSISVNWRALYSLSRDDADLARASEQTFDMYKVILLRIIRDFLKKPYL